MMRFAFLLPNEDSNLGHLQNESHENKPQLLFYFSADGSNSAKTWKEGGAVTTTILSSKEHITLR